MTGMTDAQFDALRVIVDISRNDRVVRTAADLKERAIAEGLDEDDVRQAMAYWGDHLRSIYADATDLAKSYPSGPGMW